MSSFRLLVAILAIIAPTAVSAGMAPVALTHTLTGYTKAATTVTVEYAVKVLNQKNASLDSLSLTLVPTNRFLETSKTVTLTNLGPRKVTEFKIKFVTPLMLDQKYFSRVSLHWAGKYRNGGGKATEFPVKSVAGGAK